MPAPDVVLPKPYVLVSEAASTLEGSAAGSNINFGTIDLIYETSDRFVVGDTVMYISEGQTLVSYSGVTYALITEDKILNKEVVAP